MMRQDKIFSWLASATVCSLLLATGCAPEAAEPVTLALRFTPQDSTTYKVTTQKEKSVKLEGPQPIPGFKGGHNLNRVEIIFTQQIQSIDDEGNAITKITIEGLKCSNIVKDNLVLDFDSTREKDQNNPLAKLIGQSYTIEISPAGDVIEVIDTSRAQAAVIGSSPSHKTALTLLKPEAIKARHEIMALPITSENQLQTGDNWSSTTDFSFGIMGLKSYEKIHTLKKIKDRDNHQIAVIEMDGIPSLKTTEPLDEEQATSDFSKMFDNTEIYTGELKLDLTAGKVEKYVEELQSEWIIVDPEAKQKRGSEPAALKMSATHFYRLEKID